MRTWMWLTIMVTALLADAVMVATEHYSGAVAYSIVAAMAGWGAWDQAKGARR